MQKTVIVTGSEGFVAQHTIPVLRAAGWRVRGFDFKLNTVEDLCGPRIRAALERYAPEVSVLNLAAVSRFGHADIDPAEAYRTNVGGVANLLRHAAELGVRRIVHASTASVYMPAWQIPIREHHPLGGNSHYGLSKAMGERMFGFYGSVPYIILRYAHLYGPSKKSGGLIDTFVSRVARGAAPILYGGFQTNDFTHVEDVARANLAALETAHENEVFNIGTGVETSAEDAMNKIIALTGYTGPIDRQPMRAVDAPRFALSVEKAQRLLGWSATIPFDEGLRRTLREQR